MSSLGPTGYLFIPAQCEKGKRCRIHVALHGCLQGATAIDDVFVRNAGYNGWAAAHDTIVLYPQVQSSAPTLIAWWAPFNPNGCWDWWGHTGTDYAVKTGVQIRAIIAMVDRLTQPR
jgi:poly(3-hydroxybutyrate) depolymerase